MKVEMSRATSHALFEAQNAVTTLGTQICRDSLKRAKSWVYRHYTHPLGPNYHIPILDWNPTITASNNAQDKCLSTMEFGGKKEVAGAIIHT